jgi:hypothetical protein
MKTEKQLQKYLRGECKNVGICFDKVASHSRSGFPDCCLIYKGRVVFVELKSPSGTGILADLQVRCIACLREAGAEVWVISQPPEVDRLLLDMTQE